MSDHVGRFQWEYHIWREWKPPRGASRIAYAGFAMQIASNVDQSAGDTITVSIGTLARQAGMSRRQAGTWFTRVVHEQGLFEVIGHASGHRGGKPVAVLRWQIPRPSEQDPSHCQ
jgi:hypothetical protein